MHLLHLCTAFSVVVVLALRPFTSAIMESHRESPFGSVLVCQIRFTLDQLFTHMPNQRQPGTKLAGAYISAEKDKALAELAAQKGFTNKAEFIRGLFDDAIAKNAKNSKKPKPKR